MKVVDVAWDTIGDIEKGDFSKRTIMEFLTALSTEVAFTRAYGSYRDGKHQQRHLRDHFWKALEARLNGQKGQEEQQVQQ